MAVYEVPLSAQAQSFPITLGGIDIILVVTWRNVGGSGWVLDMQAGDGTPVLSGLPLVTGLDLLGQHTHLGLPGQLWVQTDGDPDAVPTFANLGTASHLYFVVP